jgi:uroporphyrinogen decarboxylase
MTPRERALRVLTRQEADRIAIDFDIAPDPSIIQRVSAALGTSDKEAMLRALHVDFRNSVVYTSAAIPPAPYDERHRINAWGALVDIQLGTAVGHPLAEAMTIAEAERYRYLDPDDVDYAAIAKAASGHDAYCVYGGYWAPITYIAQMLFGMDRYMLLLYDDPDLLGYVLDRITDISITINKRIFRLLGKKMQVFFMGDDYGTQQDLLTSADQWRSHVKPRLQRIIDVARDAGYLVQFHSCGSIAALIADFAEMGVTCLNPMQVAARGMDPVSLKTRYGSIMSFNGGIDTQDLLPFGSADAVREAVRRTLEIMSPGGGYVLGPSQSFLPEVPTENILAIYQAAEAFVRSSASHAPS